MLNTAPILHDDNFIDPFSGKISVKGKEWVSAYADENVVEAMMQSHGLPEIVARLLVLRGVKSADVDEFLNPTLSQHFPDPSKLANMNETSEYLAQAVIEGRTIGILADFDVDGATSCAIMTKFLRAAGQGAGKGDNIGIPTFIPDRLNDGYGPSIKGFDALKDQGAEIVVVLDCGVTSIDPIAHARAIGLEIVVVDHHEPDATLPDANCIINPKLTTDNSGYDYLAAVGVTFLLCVGINAKLRHKGHYNGKNEPSMRQFLDLVALGTVCDMVPLVKANRLFVKQGFKMMAQGANMGLNALLKVSKITSLPDPYHAGFMLGPRINAGSRVHHSDLGSKLLSATCEQEAERIAFLLDDCNEKRKDIQKSMTKQAMDKAKAMMIESPNSAGLVIDGEGWHTGLSGLVAGNIKDRFEKPTCVIAYVETEEGVLEGRASGRSIPGVHIAEIFMAAQKEGLLVKGGGHAMAGGFTIMKDKIDDFRMFFNAQIERQLCDFTGADLSKKQIDLSLAVRSLNVPTAKLLIESLSPFGMGFEEPTTILSNVTIDYADQVGANHVRCTVKDAEGSVGMKAMAFRALDNDLGKMLRETAGTGRLVHLQGQVKINEWQGRQSVEFHVSDAMIADG